MDEDDERRIIKTTLTYIKTYFIRPKMAFRNKDRDDNVRDPYVCVNIEDTGILRSRAQTQHEFELIRA